MQQFIQQAAFSYRALFSWASPQTYLILKILEPLTQVAFFTLLGMHFGQDPAYMVIGNAVRLLAVSGVFGVITVVVGERSQGTLGPLVATPTSNIVKFASRGVMQVVDGLTTTILAFVFGFLLFGIHFPAINPLLFLLGLLVTSYSVSALGYAAASLCFFGPNVNIVMNVVFGLLMVLCGVNFPLGSLPEPVQWLGNSIPLTHGVAAIRALFAGQEALFFHQLGLEFLIGTLWIIISFRLFNYAEYRARILGNLDLY